MTQERLSLGAWGEDQAALYLQRQGLKIIARNLSTPVGEIDIVARVKKDLVFIEVKTRRSHAFGSPAEAVGPRKQRQVVRAAQWYMAQEKTRLQPRFDVVAVMPDGSGGAQIEHLPAAFDISEL